MIEANTIMCFDTTYIIALLEISLLCIGSFVGYIVGLKDGRNNKKRGLKHEL